METTHKKSDSPQFPELFMRSDSGLEKAPQEVQDMLKAYKNATEKGEPVKGTLITIQAPKLTVKTGEKIYVIHIVEEKASGRELFIMGPKEIKGEFINGELVTDPAPEDEYPWVPGIYDGKVLSSPGVDMNFEVTTYTFDTPGSHLFQWKMGLFVSNQLNIIVKD